MLQNTKNLFIIPLIIYPLLPFASTLVFFLLISGQKHTQNSTFYLFFFLLSFYLGLINSTKIPESDLINYINYYKNVKYYSLVEYLLLTGKEPVFFLFNYLTYHLSSGGVKFYIILSTVISYCFFFSAILKFFKKIKCNNSIIVFAIMLAAFFPQLFSLSAHLNRQFMAASILLYGIITKLFYKEKKAWPYLVISAFIHSSTLFFIPFLYWKPLKEKLSIKNSLFILIIISSIGILLPLISNFIIKTFGNNILTYAFSRINSPGIDLEPLSFLSFIVIGFNIIVLLFTQLHGSGVKFNNQNFSIAHFSNLMLIYSSFIIANIQTPALSVRFFFYTYFFFPIIFPLLFLLIKQKILIFQGIVSIGMISFFIFRLQFGPWKYASLDQLLLNNVFSFFH